jgi:hypothetical protein
MSEKNKSQKGRVAGLVIVILLYLALACIFTRPMLTQGNNATYKDPYDPTFEAWTLAWDIKQLKSNPLDLFNANIYYPNPYTLAYSDHQLTTAVMAMPVLAITGNPIQTANLMLIFNFFLGALGAYLLTNHLTRNRAAAFIAGVIFAFGAPRLSHMGHLQLSTAAWIPLCLLFLHKYSEDGGWPNAALVGLFLVLQTLATWYYGIILSVCIVLFLIVRVIMNHKGFTLRWTLTLLIALIVAGGLIMPFAIPYLKVQKHDPKFVRTIQEVDLFSADVRDFAVASDTNWLWGNLTSGLRQTTMSRGGPTERSLFPGLLPLVLGVIGAVYLFTRGKGDERFYVRFYVTLAAVSAVLCLGSRFYFFGHSVDIPMPYDLLYYAFPGFKVIRVPPRFIILVLLALGVLSAFAVRAVITRIAAKKNVGLSVVALLVIIGLLMLDLMSIALPMYKVPVNGQIPPVYTWLKEQPGDTPTVELPLANYNPKTFKDGLQYEETWLEREPLRTYYSTLHWKKILNGYSGFIPTSYYNGVKATADFPSKSSIAYLKKQGIKYIIVHGKQYDPATLQKIFDYSLKNKDLQPWKVFGSDYVYRIR